jgi:D-inositol-3-phosphate glycosyltransferase
VTRVVLAGPIPPWRSGIADQTVRLARALTRLGVDLTLVTFRRMYPRFLYPGGADRDPGGFPPDLSDVRPLLDGTNPLSFAEAGYVAASLAPDLVLLPWWTAFWAPHTAAFLGALEGSSSRAPRLLLCHNLVDHEGNAARGLLARLGLARGDRFAVQNRRDLDEVARLFPGRPAALIPHPSEPRLALVPREEARRRLGLPAGGPLFLFSGILRPYKGWDLLLAAFERVRSEIPGALLVLAGEPWGEAERLRRDGPPPGVRTELRYLPEEERALWFSACDAVVCPYRHATGSGIAADAVAFARPVIGSRVDGLLEVVEEGVSGLLVPAGDPLALAGAMLRFVREELGTALSAGAAAARERFSPAAHAARVLALGGAPAAPALSPGSRAPRC